MHAGDAETRCCTVYTTAVHALQTLLKQHNRYHMAAERKSTEGANRVTPCPTSCGAPAAVNPKSCHTVGMHSSLQTQHPCGSRRHAAALAACFTTSWHVNAPRHWMHSNGPTATHHPPAYKLSRRCRWSSCRTHQRLSVDPQ